MGLYTLLHENNLARDALVIGCFHLSRRLVSSFVKLAGEDCDGKNLMKLKTYLTLNEAYRN